MKALVLNTKDSVVHIQDMPVPVPDSKQVLVHVQAIALNHVDVLYTTKPIAAQNSRIVGSDFAGIVVELGSRSNDDRAVLGARVAGFLQGACSTNERPGAFAEYVAVDFDLTWNIPTSISFAGAASISMCGLTAAQGVFERLQLPCPFYHTDGFSSLELPQDEPVNVFIYSATSSVGLYAAQLVRLAERFSGKRIRLIGAASRSKHEFLLTAPYGYDLLVDYKDMDWPSKVRDAAGAQGIHYALDTFSQGISVELTESTLGSGGRYAVFRGPGPGNYDPAKLKIKPMVGAVWEGLGVEIGYQGMMLPRNPRAYDFAKAFFAYLGSTSSAILEPNPVRSMPGGLEKIAPEGFALLGGKISPSDGQTKEYLRPISGQKIVYKLH